MAKKNKRTLVYTTLNKMVTYLKGRNDDILTKQLFVDIRDTYPLEYNSACRFYNASGVKSLISSIRFILNKVLDDVDETNLTKNQFESMMRTVNECYNNINFDTLKSLVGEMDDDEKKQNRETLRLIIKALIILQIINNMNDVIDITIKNNGQFDYVTEHQNNLIQVITEHINDYVVTEQIWFDDRSDEIELVLDEIMSDDDARDIRKYHEDDLFINDKIDLYNDDEDEYYDRFDDILNDRLDEIIDSNKLDRFLSKLMLKETLLLRVIYNKITDLEYESLPSTRYVAFITIILLLHIMQKF